MHNHEVLLTGVLELVGLSEHEDRQGLCWRQHMA
jgi:hypothetical protein